MGESRRIAIAAFGIALMLGGSASARVQPYQVARLITFKSDCQLATLDEKAATGRTLHFFATCDNVSFYPNGVEVTCSDADDDRSCKVETQAKAFDNLRMLDKK